jgi:hypothetical protein
VQKHLDSCREQHELFLYIYNAAKYSRLRTIHSQHDRGLFSAMNLSKATLMGSLMMLAACSPSATRSPDGLLILNGDFPTTFNASEDRGVLHAKGRCIIYSVDGLGEFQPVFRKGTTRAELEKELGSLSEPRAVTTMGFEWSDSISKNLEGSDAVKDCPGRPFISSGFALTSNIETPLTPNPAHP